MKGPAVLGALIGVTLLGMLVSAAADLRPSVGRATGGQEARAVAAEKIADNLFVVRGGGGHTAAFLTADGVIVVDTKNAGWGRSILDKIRELTTKPVTTVVNTHAHGDHVGGNVEFPATMDFVAHENAAANMERMVPAIGLGQQQSARTIFQLNGGRGLPTRRFKDRLTIGTGTDRIELYYFGAGHTDGDALVVFPSARAMYAGDLFPGKTMPLIDSNNGGSGVAYPETLARAHATIRNVDTIITGHGGVLTWGDLKLHADLTRDFLATVQEGKKAGKTVEQIATAWTIPAKYAGYGPPRAELVRSNVTVLWNEIR